MEENEEFLGIDLQEIFGKVWSIRYRLLMFQILTAALCVLVVLFWPRSYRSEARIFFQLGREAIGIDPTAATGHTVGVQQSSREDEIVTAMEVLRGRGMIGKVVEQLTPEVVLSHAPLEGEEQEDGGPGLMSTLVGSVTGILSQIDPISDSERAVILVEKNLSVDAERKSEVVVVQYKAKSAKLAQAVVDTLVKVYKEENARLHRTEGSQDFFDAQQELLAENLQCTNEKLREAKNRMGLASINGQRDSLESRAREISQNIAETERNLFEADARLVNIRAELESVPERISSAAVEKPNAATDLKSTQLYALQLLEVEYRAKYAPDHPKLISIRSQVEEAERQYQQQSTARSETTNDINPIHRELSLDLLRSQTAKAGYEKKLQTLQKQSDDLLEKLRQINTYEIEIADLEREARLNEKKYVSYSESLEQARINKALEANKISSVSIAQEATLQERPISPSKPLVCIFGLMTLGVGSVCLGLLHVKMDDRITTPLAIRKKVGIPVLVTIPKSRSMAKSKRFRYS